MTTQHAWPPRVTIPLAGFNLSGGVKSLCHLANYLSEHGWDVTMIVPDYACEPPIKLGPRVLVQVTWTGPRLLPASVRKARHLIRLCQLATRDADVCLANYFTTAYAAWISRWLLSNRCVLAYNVRGYEPESHGRLANAGDLSRRVRSLAALWSYRLPLKKLCTTEWLRDQVGDPNAIVVGHGIDLDIFSPTNRDPNRSPVTIGTIGRAGEAKGYPDFIAAVRLLDPATHVRFLIAAPDPVEPVPDFPAEIRHPRTEPEMAAFYRDCDVFVFSSRGEGFGLPALEAMATGSAVITTDSGGVRAFAEPDQNCLITPIANASALATAITELAANPTLRAHLDKAGITTATHHSRQAAHERFAAALASLL
ncbi:MAG: glycosyltransferase family 4 protein [Chloroflexota bacterium]